ncbi:hypothetical protein KR009_004563, partial [Drosophila setifemur]
KDGFAFKTSICEGKNGGLLPMFGTCTGYYICVDGNAVIGSCDKNMLFNPLTLHCDDANKVDCIFETREIETSSELSSESDEEDDDDEVILQTRPPVTTTTKPPKRQRPQIQTTEISNRICAAKKDGVMLSKKGNCREYFVCKAKKPHLRSCSGQQHFSPTRRMCMKASEAKCMASGSESNRLDGPAVTGGLCPEEKENSLVAHQSDCGKFMLCSNMMFLVMDCPTGLHFNTASSRCDYPKIAQCQATQKKTKSNKKSKKNGRKPKARPL